MGASVETKRDCKHVVINGQGYCEYYVEYTYTGQCMSEPLPGEPPLHPEPGDEFHKDGKTYAVCGTGDCYYSYDHEQIYCLSNQADKRCTGKCECMLLRANKNDKEPKWEPEPDSPDGSKRYPYKPDDYFYCCACVKPE